MTRGPSSNTSNTSNTGAAGNPRVTLNADVGESDELLASGAQEQLLALVDLANVACGGHAGDERSMRETVRQCARLRVECGAHPSYPDRENFGRARTDMAPDALAASIAAQVRALAAICAGEGVGIAHVKPHGALYHDVSDDPVRALAFAESVTSVLPRDTALVVRAGCTAVDALRARGFRVLAEGFADRATDAHGRLVPRSQPGAVLHDPAAAAMRARVLIETGACDTLCVHSDTPGAVAIARAVRDALAPRTLIR